MVSLLEKINVVDAYKYAYLTTRLKGMENKLLTQEKFKRILDSKNLDDLSQLLEDTDYKKIPYKNLEELNNFLDEYFIQFLNNISVFIPSAVKDCIFVLKEYTKLQDFKLAVKSVITNDETLLDFLSPLTKIQPNINNLDFLNTQEFKEIKRNVLNYIEKKDFSQVSYELENHFFKSIKKTINKRNLIMVKNFFRKKADIINIVIKIRSLLLGFDAENYLDYGFIEIKKIKNQKSIDALISSLVGTEYHVIFLKTVNEFNKTGNYSVFDRVMDEFLMELLKKTKSSEPFGFGFVFWFIITKDREIRKLKALFKIISDDLPKDYFEVFAW